VGTPTRRPGRCHRESGRGDHPPPGDTKWPVPGSARHSPRSVVDEPIYRERIATVGKFIRLLVVSAFLGMSAACGSAPPSESHVGTSNLRQAALIYAQVTRSGSFAELEATLSPECRSTDHITAQNLPLLRMSWEHQFGFSFDKVQITGVRIRDVTRTSAQAEVEYNESAAGNYNWVTYIFDHDRWEVGGQCATPIGNSESSLTRTRSCKRWWK
jgi:hypothetical protein